MIKSLHKFFTKVLFILRETLKFFLTSKEDIILIEGYPESKNFGDALNIPLVLYLSERKKVIIVKYVRAFKNRINKLPAYTVIGSIIQSVRPNSIIWGAGFIKQDSLSFSKPNSILAVRGPKTREILIEKGFECPKIYGDPAMLLPLIYFPQKSKTIKIGIIPHYEDLNEPWILKYKSDHHIKIIDVNVGEDYKAFIDQLLACESILTSSLHGLILSYAYGIPVCRIKLSDRLVGGDFKFDDFLLSINKEPKAAIQIFVDMTPYELLDNLDYERIEFNYYSLINSCPFITPKRRDTLIKRAQELF